MKTELLAFALGCALWVGAVGPTGAQTTESAASVSPANPKFEPERAKRLGADPIGMRSYVMVILKTGPNKMPAGKERDEMFAGHFANIKRLSDDGKLLVAGPADGVDGWRGIFILAVKEVEEARLLTATDPVIGKGEMVADYHKLYMSAALMEIPALHPKVAEKVL